MKEYPDPHQHLHDFMEHAIDRDVENLQKAGITPSKGLINALVDRACEEAKADYFRQTQEVFDLNVKELTRQHKHDVARVSKGVRHMRRNHILKDWKFYACILVSLSFGIVAWSTWSQGHIGMSILYGIGSLIMIILALI